MPWSVVVLVAIVVVVAAVACFVAGRCPVADGEAAARAAMERAMGDADLAAEERERAAAEVQAQADPGAQATAAADASNAVGLVEAQAGDLGAQAATVAGLIGAGLPEGQNATPAAKVAL